MTETMISLIKAWLWQDKKYLWGHFIVSDQLDQTYITGQQQFNMSPSFFCISLDEEKASLSTVIILVWGHWTKEIKLTQWLCLPPATRWCRRLSAQIVGDKWSHRSLWAAVNYLRMDYFIFILLDTVQKSFGQGGFQKEGELWLYFSIWILSLQSALEFSLFKISSHLDFMRYSYSYITVVL